MNANENSVDLGDLARGGPSIESESLDLFENGIGWAIKQMWIGHAVARENWNGPDQELRLQAPDEDSKMSLPYIYIKTVQGDLVPWLASQTDILALDWYVVASAVTLALEGNEEAVQAYGDVANG